MNPRPAVNLSAMTVLFGVEDRKLFTRILNGFIGSENSKIVDALCAAIEAGNIGEISSEAHKLKSASRVVGADALAEVCKIVEEACRKQDLSDAFMLCRQVRDRFNDVNTFVRNWSE